MDESKREDSLKDQEQPLRNPPLSSSETATHSTPVKKELNPQTGNSPAADNFNIKPLLQAGLKNLLSPTVLTIIISSIAAPIAVTFVNGNIENKKIQSDIVTKLLTMTSETKFESEEDLRKVETYSAIITDNSHIFDVRLKRTLTIIDSAFSRVRARLKLREQREKLNKQLQDEMKKSNDLEKNNVKIKQRISNLNRQLGQHQGNKEKLEKAKKKAEQELKDNEAKMKQLVGLLNRLNRERILFRRFYSLSRQRQQRLSAKLKTADETITKLTKSRSVDRNELQKLTSALKTSKDTIDTLNKDLGKLQRGMKNLCSKFASGKKPPSECIPFIVKPKKGNQDLAQAPNP